MEYKAVDKKTLKNIITKYNSQHIDKVVDWIYNGLSNDKTNTIQRVMSNFGHYYNGIHSFNDNYETTNKWTKKESIPILELDLCEYHAQDNDDEEEFCTENAPHVHTTIYTANCYDCKG